MPVSLAPVNRDGRMKLLVSQSTTQAPNSSSGRPGPVTADTAITSRGETAQGKVPGTARWTSTSGAAV